MASEVKRYYCASYGELIFYPREPGKDYAQGWPYEVVLASDHDAHKCEQEALLAEVESALSDVEGWRGLDGDGITDPVWSKVLAALAAVRAARKERA